MTQYKIAKINIGNREFQYTINRVDGNDLVPVIPIKYYKTKAGAIREIEKRQSRK